MQLDLEGPASEAKKASLAAMVDEVVVHADQTLRPVIEVPGLELNLVPGPDDESEVAGTATNPSGEEDSSDSGPPGVA